MFPNPATLCIRHRKRFVFAALFLVALVPCVAYSATITQTASDAVNTSSFNTGLNWSDGNAPSSANNYTSAGPAGSPYTLRTPNDGNNYTFQGNSLYMEYDSITFKGTGAGAIITIPSLTLDRNAGLSNSSAVTNNFAGMYTLVSPVGGGGAPARLAQTSGASSFTISATVTGVGGFQVTNNATAQLAISVTLNNPNNTYSGGTLVTNFSNLIAGADGALGTGNVSITGGEIQLTGGTTNSYINSTANFLVSTGLATGAVNLNYTGTDTVGGISLNAGSSFLSPGVYTTSQLDTLYGSNAFTGTGALSVVPEPAAWVWMLTAVALLGGWNVRRRRKQQCA